MENFKISVIICTHNRADMLRVALDSLGRNQLFRNTEYQIVVVDDGSTDHTAQVVKEANLLCDLQYYRIQHSGRAAARNRGMRECTGDYILFVDDDIIAPPDLLEEHYAYHRKYPHSVIRGPIINVTEHKIPEGRATTWRDFSSAFFCTCNASVNKFALEVVGGFDESFVEYGFEDNELGWRLREKGWVARFNMNAPIYHYKPMLKKDQLNEMIQRAQELGRSAVTYYNKHPHWKVALATGLHPALSWWNVIDGNKWLFDYCLKRWNESAETLPLNKRAFYERRIFKYHYLRSLDAEKKRIAAGGTSRSRVRRPSDIASLEAEAAAEHGKIPRTDSPRAADQGPPAPPRGSAPPSWAGPRANQASRPDPGAPPKAVDGPRGGPSIGESGRIVNKNLRPNVHLQPKTPPGKGPGSPF